MSAINEIHIKGEVYSDKTYMQIEEINHTGTYLFQIGDEFRQHRFYYLNNTFIHGDVDFLGMSHDGPIYWEIMPDSFIAVYNELVEDSKDDKEYIGRISPNVDKAIREHEEFLEEELSTALRENLELKRVPKNKQMEFGIELLDTAPTMDAKEEKIEELHSENKILRLLEEKFTLEHTPEDERLAITDEILKKSSSKDAKEIMIIRLMRQNRSLRIKNDQNNE